MSIVPEKETLTVEFKSDRDRLSDDDLLEEIVGMANTQGGDIYIGVEDDGTPTGLHSTHRDSVRLAAMVGNKTVPSVSVRTAMHTVGGVQIVVVSVPSHSGTLVATASGKITRRRLKHTALRDHRYIPMRCLGCSQTLEASMSRSSLPVRDPCHYMISGRGRLRQIMGSYNGDRPCSP